VAAHEAQTALEDRPERLVPVEGLVQVVGGRDTDHLDEAFLAVAVHLRLALLRIDGLGSEFRWWGSLRMAPHHRTNDMGRRAVGGMSRLRHVREALRAP
jgi:hypothetical protein